MAIKAKYAGKCKRCHRDFPAGTMIENDGVWWIPVDCSGCAKDAARLDILLRLKKELLETSNIALGCWGIPEGSNYTFTRRQWLQAAIDNNVGTSEEHNQLRFYWAGLMDRDLSD